MRALVVVAFAAALALGCSSSSDGSKASEGNPLCIPGAQVACACPGGAPGAQACLATGQGYGECLCPDAAAPEPDAEATDAIGAATDGPSGNEAQPDGDGSPTDSPDEVQPDGSELDAGHDDSGPTDAGFDSNPLNESPNIDTDSCTFPGGGSCDTGMTFVVCEGFGYPFRDCTWIPGVDYVSQQWCCPESCVRTSLIGGCPAERPASYKCDSHTTDHHVRPGCEPNPYHPESLCCPRSTDGT